MGLSFYAHRLLHWFDGSLLGLPRRFGASFSGGVGWLGAGRWLWALVVLVG